MKSISARIVCKLVGVCIALLPIGCASGTDLPQDQRTRQALVRGEIQLLAALNELGVDLLSTVQVKSTKVGDRLRISMEYLRIGGGGAGSENLRVFADLDYDGRLRWMEVNYQGASVPPDAIAEIRSVLAHALFEKHLVGFVESDHSVSVRNYGVRVLHEPGGDGYWINTYLTKSGKELTPSLRR